MEVNNHVVIVFLVLLLLLTVLGVNWNGEGKYLAEGGIHLLGDLAFGISSNAGKLVNASSDTVAVVARTGVDITNGAVHDAGYMMQGKSLDMALHQANYRVSEPDPAAPKEPSAPATLTWCLVEKKEHGDNTCIRIDEGTKCSSGQVFTSESKCRHSQ